MWLRELGRDLCRWELELHLDHYRVLLLLLLLLLLDSIVHIVT